MLGTFVRLLIRVILPARNWEAATGWWQVVNGAPIAGSIATCHDAWWQGLGPAETALIVLSGFAVLSLHAGYRLLQEKEERDSRKPLEISGSDPDGDWRRLVISNPNSFPVRGAFVRVTTRGELPNGWVFSWSTNESDEVVLEIDLGADGGKRILDVCRRTVVLNAHDRVIEATVFRRPPGESRLSPYKTLDPGEHLFDVEVRADGVPANSYQLVIDVQSVDVELTTELRPVGRTQPV